MQKKIIQEICNRKFDFGDHPAESVLEFLYIAYAEIGKKDNVKIEQGFAAVDRFCEGKTFEESTAIFNTVCDLCIECVDCSSVLCSLCLNVLDFIHDVITRHKRAY